MIRAVTFDFWQTLVSERHGPSSEGVARGEMRVRQVEQFSATLADAGIEVPNETLYDAFASNWERFEHHWERNLGQYTPSHSVDHVCDRLGIDHANGLRDRLVDGFRVVGETVPLHVAPRASDALRLLRDAGVRTAVVCDVGLTSAPTLRLRLAEFGLLDLFDAWAFSDETGWFKPAPEAFAPALEAMDAVNPRDAAHVGDNPRTDIAGARGLGMVSVRYTGFRDAAPAGGMPEADHVIDDLGHLPELVGAR